VSEIAEPNASTEANSRWPNTHYHTERIACAERNRFRFFYFDHFISITLLLRVNCDGSGRSLVHQLIDDDDEREIRQRKYGFITQT
jgi:hypothetical protein